MQSEHPGPGQVRIGGGMTSSTLGPIATRRAMLTGAVGTAAACVLRVPAFAASEQTPAQMNFDRKREENAVNTITTKDGTQIFYRDWGKGQPIAFHHGWPLSG